MFILAGDLFFTKMFARACTCLFYGLFFVLLTNLCDATENATIPEPPLEFPKNESLYPFRHNVTSLKALIEHTSNNTEADDLLHGGLFVNNSRHGSATSEEIPAQPENPGNSPGERKWDAELIEDGTKTEDGAKVEEATIKGGGPVPSTRVRDSYGSKMPVVQGQLAAILAGVLVVLAVLGYAALLSWRRFLETRYGNREMLVNEEDFYDPNDLRHFSLDQRVQYGA